MLGRRRTAGILLAVVGVVLATLTGPPAMASTASTGSPSDVPGLAASGSVLGYQCGEGICLIDPDVANAEPVQVVPDGTFAGVTKDGRMVAWVQPGGDLVVAPTTGGTPTTVYTGGAGLDPQISGDGSRFIWTSPVPIYIGAYAFYYTYRFEVATGELVGVGACACASSHGFAGQTAIGAFPAGGGDPSQICIMGTDAETGTSSACGPVQANEARGVLSFPDATQDGRLIVAAMDPANSEYGGSQGRIALYSAATGGLVKDLTTNDTDTTPTISQDGTRAAFERADQIVVVDVATGAEHVVAPGINPSWGGTPSATGGPTAAAKVKGTALRLTSGKIKAPVACSGLGACQGRATLTKPKATKVLAKATYAITAGERGKVVLKPTQAGKKLFKGDGKVTLKLTLKGNGKTVRAKVTVRY